MDTSLGFLVLAPVAASRSLHICLGVRVHMRALTQPTATRMILSRPLAKLREVFEEAGDGTEALPGCGPSANVWTSASSKWNDTAAV